MNIIGDPESFAAKIEISERPNEWFWGHFCFIVRGEIIGSFEEEISLNVTAGFLIELLWSRGRRQNRKLFDLDVEDIFSFLDDKLYETENKTSEECEENWVLYGSHNAFGSGIDVLDGWKAYLIENDLDARFIWSLPSGEVREHKFGSGDFDAVLEQVVAFLGEVKQ